MQFLSMLVWSYVRVHNICSSGSLRICLTSPDAFRRDLMAHVATRWSGQIVRRCIGSSLMVAKIASGTDVTFLLGIFQSNSMIHVADYASDFVFVHAGVVVHKGRALLFPGTSFAGKSTLVASLVRAGATYYSDEYALLDTDGLVHPFARNLQMREPGGREQRSVPVEEFQGVAGTEPVPVARILFQPLSSRGRMEARTPGTWARRTADAYPRYSHS